MPLGDVVAEFVLKATSVRTVPLNGDQVRIEVDLAGDVKGLFPGRHFGTLISYPIEAARPYAWSYSGRTLGDSGAVVRVTGDGTAVHTGEGHKIRFRGAERLQTNDPALAELNGVIVALEAEADPLTVTLAGAAYMWR
jgi:hypothetical protein